MTVLNEKSLDYHITQVKDKKRTFENAFKGVLRMMLEIAPEKIIDCGKTKFDYPVFRQGKKHLIGLYDTINSFVHFVKDAADKGPASEMAFVLVSQPGTGKTFFFDELCRLYRAFLNRKENTKYTFRFAVNKLGNYGKIPYFESQTYEDPMILAMNLIKNQDENKEYLCKTYKITEKDAEDLYEDYRPLGADSAYILEEIRAYADNNFKKMLELIEIVPVPIIETLGTITTCYPAKDKITSSAVDLIGDLSLDRLLQISDLNNPYRTDLRQGALASVAGGGIFFGDEFFKHKIDLLRVYLRVIQNRIIEIKGFKWPIDTLIVGTSNNEEYERFRNEQGETPIVDRCKIHFVPHNTDYVAQEKLTHYYISSKPRTTITGEKLHQDPNLNFVLSVCFTLTRLPRTPKLSVTEMLELAAGKTAGEKSIKTLSEVIDELNKDPNILNRFGQRGLGHRDLGRAHQFHIESSKTNEGKCLVAGDVFPCIERVILDYVLDASERSKYLEDLEWGKKIYDEHIKTCLYNAYRDDPEAIKKDVRNYIDMILGKDAKNVGTDRIWRYKDPQTGKMVSIQIDERFINSVEERLGLKTDEQKESFRTSILKIFGQKLTVDPNYDFMDNHDLVKAVTEVRMESDIAGAASLVGALANRTNKENRLLYDRIINTMVNKMGYCITCAEKTIELTITKHNSK